MGNKLFIGNISFSVDDGALSSLFSAHGTVQSARVVTDRQYGRSRGFGFVEMSSDSEAQAAIHAINGKDVGGRQIAVSEAKPQAPREGGSRDSYRGQNSGSSRW